MKNLSLIGRIFFGIAIAGIGFLTIYYDNFGYMLIPTKHLHISGIGLLAYIIGALFMLVGISIVFKIKTGLISLLFASMLLLICCFYIIPYELMNDPDYLNFGHWENAEKVSALCGGAFLIFSCFNEKNKNPFLGFLSKLAPYGVVFFSIPIICFGILHFLYAKDTADYAPAWVPFKLFWVYLCGCALIFSGIAILLKIKPRLIAALLGTMIFTWFIILHIPRIVASPLPDMGGEFLGAFLALAYSGIALVIPGCTKK